MSHLEVYAHFSPEIAEPYMQGGSNSEEEERSDPARHEIDLQLLF